MGYEGYLTDNYYALLAVAVRQSEIPWKSGYRPNDTRIAGRKQPVF
jgi:hypothetical protein